MTTICHRCEIPIHEDQDYVSAPGIGTYCEPCFKCDQCFQDFPNDIYFEAENKLYCKECFDCLYSPICAGCNLPITGKYKIAMGKKWHAECLVCSTCGIELWKDVNGFKQSPDGRALCNTHYEMERAMGFDKERCAFENCKKIVEKTEMIRYKNEAYHAYHFKCSECNCELDGSAKELKGKLFCLPCHDKQDDIHICSACHKPIDGRRIYALDAFWHVEHFVCTTCQRPFLGKMHYEHQGQAYCEIHFKEIIGVRCFSCNKIITSEHVKALNKPWCTPCFRCSKCDCHLSLKEKITSIDGKPTCLKCWGQIPSEMKKRIKNGMGR